ncbi:manganese efflux pump MntP family protein [Paenibacillus sp. sptzw28]|uniref:manganese efflux pump MntP n=1 Tax=Paenibacillus sp. sptzw28 TaxID=715179 RepID=UPI001C6E3213|nr:manganese efflux pump [Paenibacillus sp. sptzw28]QYR22043.1 manganese efflux pump MntP family protein [Paenibacillus sp. sptzw28]
MIDAGMQTGQLLTLLIIALALGMDAFSLGIGIGLRGIRLRDVLKLSTLIALFHIFMPLMGMVTGKYVSTLLGGLATNAAGGLLLLLGAHMIYSSFRGGGAASPIDHRTSWGMLLFALSVSIDSFSVGISLGMFAADVLLTVLLFGFTGGLLSILGLLIGRRVNRSLGEFGEACGGVILLTFGLLFLF